VLINGYIGAGGRTAKGRGRPVRGATMRFGDDDGGVTITQDGGIAQVRLDRPDKLNALSPAMFKAIAAAIEYLAADANLRCVVLAGEGRSFCAGIDLAALMAGGIEPLAPRTYGEANLMQFCATGWRRLSVPVIAALHGHVFGAGLQIALGADVRIAASDARLSVMEMKHGLVPDLGGYMLARGLVRADHWRELVYTAREVNGEHGQSLGLVTRVADNPLAEATALARDIAQKSSHAIRAAKRLANAMDDAEAATLLRAESDEQQALVDALLGAGR
jgi:enoyl-CoA hydratase/carnithine racemase